MSKNLFDISDQLINDVKSVLGEKLTGGQVNLDVDKDGKIEASDFKKLRNKKLAAKMKKHETGETAGQEKKEHSGPCSADCDCMKEDVLGEGDPIVRTKSFPGEPPEGTYADMRRKGTLPKPIQAKDAEHDKNKKETQKTFPNVKYFTKNGHPDWAKHDSMKEEAKMIHSVHVRDYGDDDHNAASQFHHPDFDKTVKAHGGDFHYHSDKGIAFKFAQPHHARAFAGEVNRKFKSLDADTPEHVHEEAKDETDTPPWTGSSKKVPVGFKPSRSHRQKLARSGIPKKEDAIDEARGRPKKVKPGEEAADNEGDDTGSIVMKLRKASSIGKPVQFKDSSTHNISKSDARKALAKHDALRTSIEKENLADRMHASHASFKDVLAGKGEPEEMTLMQKIKAARAARQ